MLEALDLNKIEQGKNRPRQVGQHAGIRINNRRYLNGFHTQTESLLYLELDGQVQRFVAEVGVDDRGTSFRHDPVDKTTSFAEFQVIGDGNTLWKSETIRYGEDARPVDVDLEGVKTLLLKVTGGPGNTHVSWANGSFSYSGECPVTVWSPERAEAIRKSLEFVENQRREYPEPRINGAMVVGIRPDTPFYYPVAVTGKRPIEIGAEGLPQGLVLDEKTGIITGVPADPGDYEVELTAGNSYGRAERLLTISVGDRLALTPPMGFLSWNVVQGLVSEAFLKELADAFVSFGLRDAGYQYINMDDCWEGVRDKDGRIAADPVRFPNGILPASEYIHEKGLKFGIYSTPGPVTCAGFPGTMGFEELDVETWVSWGVDYLKYDGCYTPPDRSEELYTLMGRLLEESGRSIVYCGKRAAGSQLWRIGGDLRDQWAGKNRDVGIVQSFEMAQERARTHGPGGWNDPDMLVVGIRGKGASGNDKTDETGCSDTEYRSHMSLWALMSAPLFITIDVRQIDPVSLEILTNPEVIDVNQDPLGRFPVRIGGESEQEVWVKEMADGSKAVALLNKADTPEEMVVSWEDLDLTGSHGIRDLWKRENLGEHEGSYSSRVPPHGVVLIRISSETAGSRGWDST